MPASLQGHWAQKGVLALDVLAVCRAADKLTPGWWNTFPFFFFFSRVSLTISQLAELGLTLLASL